MACARSVPEVNDLPPPVRQRCQTVSGVVVGRPLFQGSTHEPPARNNGRSVYDDDDDCQEVSAWGVVSTQCCTLLAQQFELAQRGPYAEFAQQTSGSYLNLSDLTTNVDLSRFSAVMVDTV